MICPECKTPNESYASKCKSCGVVLKEPTKEPFIQKDVGQTNYSLAKKEQVPTDQKQGIRQKRRISFVILLILITSVIILFASTNVIKRNNIGLTGLFQKPSPKKVIHTQRCKIEGILYSERDSSVVIDGREYRLNEFVCGGRIVKIRPYGVTLEFQKDYQMGDAVDLPN